jgi:hypothetical protein
MIIIARVCSSNRPLGDLGRARIMNRDEAIRLLKGGEEGVGEWNRRREDGETIPTLAKASRLHVPVRKMPADIDLIDDDGVHTIFTYHSTDERNGEIFGWRYECTSALSSTKLIIIN